MKKMGVNKIVVLVTGALILLTAAFIYTRQEKVEIYEAGLSDQVVVEQTWNLPDELQEVSGITFIDDHKIACVQDEKGVIYIYDLQSSSIQQEIKFSEPGDYEGIAVSESTAYVLRADGTIFKVASFLEHPEIEMFETRFNVDNDLEGLYFDQKLGQLVLAVKGKDPNSNDIKGFYSLDPNSMSLSKKPLYQLNFQDSFFDDIRERDPEDTFFPSEILRDPNTGNLLVLEARNPRLLILDPQGKPLEIHGLNGTIFSQPEGLAADPAGNLYISSEGKPGTIHRVSINQK